MIASLATPHNGKKKTPVLPGFIDLGQLQATRILPPRNPQAVMVRERLQSNGLQTLQMELHIDLLGILLDCEE
jgi:hypothetical protein